MDLKAFAGQSAGPFEQTIDPGAVAQFARSIGAPQDGSVPMTFLTLFRKGEKELLERMRVALSGILHGEQEYTFHAPLRAGDRVRYETRLANVLEKRGRAGNPGLRILVFESKFETERGEAASARTTVLYREGEA